MSLVCLAVLLSAPITECDGLSFSPSTVVIAANDSGDHDIDLVLTMDVPTPAAIPLPFTAWEYAVAHAASIPPTDYEVSSIHSRGPPARF